MSIADALSDIKDAVLSGKPLDMKIISEVALDYDLNPSLLERKINESGWTEEGIRRFSAHTNSLENAARRILSEYPKDAYVADRFSGTIFDYKGDKWVYLGEDRDFSNRNKKEYVCMKITNNPSSRANLLNENGMKSIDIGYYYNLNIHQSYDD